MNKELIEKNKEEFNTIFKNLIIKEYPTAQGLYDWINGSENDFFVAPASTKFHLAEAGGLCLHSLNVYKRLVNLCKWEFGDKYKEILGVTDGDLALIGLCHDLCKAQTYEIDYKNTKKYSDSGSKIDEKGKFDWVTEPYYRVNEKFVFGHGSKSVFIIQNFIQGLSLNVAMAIRFHMGGSEYTQTPAFNESGLVLDAYGEFPIVLLTHMADSLATFIDENETYDFGVNKK